MGRLGAFMSALEFWWQRLSSVRNTDNRPTSFDVVIVTRNLSETLGFGWLKRLDMVVSHRAHINNNSSKPEFVVGL